MFRNPFFIAVFTVIAAVSVYFVMDKGLSHDPDSINTCAENAAENCQHKEQGLADESHVKSESINKHKASENISESIPIETDKPILIDENTPTPDLYSDAKTTSIERDDELALNEEDIAISNNIANAILDTLVAEITTVDKSKAADKHQISVNFKWHSNLDILRKHIGSAFTYKQTAVVSSDPFSRVMYTIPKPNEDSPSYGAFNALLENKISLIVQVGEEEKLITIASGYRDKNGKLEYVLLPSKDASRNALFVKDESTPVVFVGFSFDEVKLARKASLGIILHRLDTGRAFRIMLDEKDIE